jgi:hypothetical protein
MPWIVKRVRWMTSSMGSEHGPAEVPRPCRCPVLPRRRSHGRRRPPRTRGNETQDSGQTPRSWFAQPQESQLQPRPPGGSAQKSQNQSCSISGVCHPRRNQSCTPAVKISPGREQSCAGPVSIDPRRRNGARDADSTTTVDGQPRVRGSAIANSRETSRSGLGRLSTVRMRRCARLGRLLPTVRRDCTSPGETVARPFARANFTFLPRARAYAREDLPFRRPRSRSARRLLTGTGGGRRGARRDAESKDDPGRPHGCAWKGKPAVRPADVTNPCGAEASLLLPGEPGGIVSGALIGGDRGALGPSCSNMAVGADGQRLWNSVRTGCEDGSRSCVRSSRRYRLYAPRPGRASLPRCYRNVQLADAGDGRRPPRSRIGGLREGSGHC